MPDIWAHILFGEEVLTGITGVETGWIKRWERLFRLGCQGPDFYFYYRFWPWQETNRIDDIGRKIQNQVGGQFVRTAVRYLKNLGAQRVSSVNAQSFPQPVDKSGDNLVESEEYQELLVYLFGFICHYALDAAVHPYIHYKSGVFIKSEPSTHKYYGNHKLMESTLDSILLQEKRGVQPRDEAAQAQIDVGVRLPRVVLEFHQFMVKEYFDQDVKADAINQAYLDMVKALNIFYDPSKIKTGFVHLVRFLTFGKVDYTHFFYPKIVDNSVDYLNRKQEKWTHPTFPDEVHYESFDQLWNRAVEWARDWLNATLQYLHGEIDKSALDEHIPNLSFSSGKLPGEADERTMKYVGPIVDL